MLVNSFQTSHPLFNALIDSQEVEQTLQIPCLCRLLKSCQHDLLAQDDTMMNEADFAALNKHLEEVRPIFDDFCARHGFVYVDRRSLGRYPRIRIEKLGTPTIWFDLWMEFDKDGQRFNRFSRNLPYELSAGASLPMQDGSRYGIRFDKCLQCFSGKPFDQVEAILRGEMEKHLPTLEGWNAQYLKENGEKVKLGD